MPDGEVDLIYVDPPFNTGRTQARRSIRTVRDEVGGDRVGFQGNRYRTIEVGSTAFSDSFDDYLSFLEPRFREARRVLKSNGSFFLHVDYREVHYCKVLLDEVFGRDSFINEIVWAYDYGARSKSRWPAKHDNILWYAKDPDDYTFNYEDVDRIPYMAPGLVEAGQGREGEDADGRLVAHHRADEREGEDGVSDAEASGHRGADRARSLEPGRRGAGLLRGEWNDRRGRGEAGEGVYLGGQ